MIDRLMPAAASAHAASLDGVLHGIHWHILLIGSAWLAVFLYAIIRFRQAAHPEARQHGVRGVWPALAIGAVIVGDVIILTTQALPAWSERI